MPATDAPRPRGWYEAFGRRAFFALDPERSHRVALAMLALPLPWRRIGHAVADPALATTVAGVPLANPVGLASGFDKACERLAALGALGFGYAVGGTVTLRPRLGNPKPRIARDPARRAIVNAMGLPNPGAHAVAAALAKRPRTTSRWVSLADEELDDACAALDLVAPLADAIELNASSPNAGWTHRADHVGALVAAMRPRTDTALFVKVPPFTTDDERSGVLAIVEAARQAGAHGLTATNTIPVADVRMSTGRGGLSGGPLTVGTPQIVKTIHEATGGALPINACGGIFTPDDAQACLAAGAMTVQVYTSLIYQGPAVASRILAGLAPR
ncbi:MAG TPA: dihydroorotate dehydrogenase 2 [Actinomycetota bacterium]|nr:dihydroorotate dehydrogenase 2 [Actinomycetota bacterium]